MARCLRLPLKVNCGGIEFFNLLIFKPLTDFKKSIYLILTTLKAGQCGLLTKLVLLNISDKVSKEDVEELKRIKQEFRLPCQIVDQLLSLEDDTTDSGVQMRFVRNCPLIKIQIL